jgi:hypothetical protein
MQPFDEIPKWVAAADVIAIPQKDSPATWGQLPSKVFDAMAMAKPIVATDVNDLSMVLSMVSSSSQRTSPSSGKQHWTYIETQQNEKNSKRKLGSGVSNGTVTMLLLRFSAKLYHNSNDVASETPPSTLDRIDLRQCRKLLYSPAFIHYL